MIPTVSILIPVYNCEKYLRQCLDSVVGQTHRALQVVIIDDGSTDGSLAICREYADKYPFAEVYHQENKGVATTRNILLSKIKGDYTIFVDADDWIEPTMIEDMLAYIRDYNLDIAICGSVSEHDGNYTPIERTTQEPLIENREQIIKKFLLHKELSGALWNKLVKTNLLHKLRFDPEISYGEDALFLWHVLQRVNRVGTVTIQYYHYRMNEASISHQTFGPKKMTGHKVWQQVYDDTAHRWPKYESLALASFAVSDMWLIFGALRSGYKKDENIMILQQNLRDNIEVVGQSGILSATKVLFARIVSYSYAAGNIIIKLMRY